MRFGKYEIINELGRGGFGIVYKAKDVTLDRVVALKVLHPQLSTDEKFIQLFQREARSLAKIDHPNVVTIHEIGEINGQVFIAMRYLAGGSLSGRMKREGLLPHDEVFRIITEVADGLDAVHKCGIIHQDVKPGNILFDEDGRAVIADFSIARVAQMTTQVSSPESMGFVGGSPSYMAPEMWEGSLVTPAADQYSLACVLCELLLGKKLFEGETTAKIMHKHFTPVSLPESLAPGLRTTLLKALAREPEHRFADMEAFLQALNHNGKTDFQTQFLRAEVPELISTANDKLSNQQNPQVPPKHGKLTKFKAARLPAWLPWLVGGAVLVLCLAFIIGEASNAGSNFSMPIASETLILTKNYTNTPAPTKTATLIPTVTPTPPPARGDTRIRTIDGMEQVFIPKGSFTMGSNNERAEEQPVHEVSLHDYWIDKYEVTNSQYQLCVTAGACDAPDDTRSPTGKSYFGNAAYGDYPVIYVSWNDANNYCEWSGGWLPTEAEWEKAARGDSDRRTFPWGEFIDGNRANYCDRNCTLDWKTDADDDGFADTSPVGWYPSGASPYGALDMAGNVCEWVFDLFGKDFYSSNTTWNNPDGPEIGTKRVLRGGSWYDSSKYLSVSIRLGFAPGSSFYDVGFRCASAP
ncbi:MAG: bifunctional serine/threonine-protein kinase/formylglycine-generating enzyme family protein [Anaerolineaceae bacterium]